MRISIPYCVDFQLLIALQTPFTFCHYAISHDEDTFPDSFTFKPERWLRDGRERPNPFGSIPFGFGVRGCVGRRIAELEMYLLLFQVSDKKEKKLLNIPGKLLDFFKCDPGVSNNKCRGLGGGVSWKVGKNLTEIWNGFINAEGYIRVLCISVVCDCVG